MISSIHESVGPKHPVHNAPTFIVRTADSVPLCFRWFGAAKCLSGAAHENLGEHDDQLDENEKTEFGAQAMQNCDSAHASRLSKMNREDVDARHKACARAGEAGPECRA